MQDSISFNGLLYGINRHHITKPVMCCHHGDAKFVKLLNNSANTSLGKFFERNSFSFYEDEGVPYLRIKTKEIPKFNFLERLFYDISSHQKNLIKKREENVFTDLVFKLNKYEFEYLKNNYLLITQKQLESFKDFILKHVSKSERSLAEDFFSR